MTTSLLDKTASFALVKQARSLITGVNESASEATLSQYRAAFLRMQARKNTPEQIANTARSFYYYRAAWVHHFSSAIRGVLNEADRAQREKNEAGWQELIRQLPKLIDALERYRPDPARQNITKGWVGQWAVEAERRVRAGTSINSHSKKHRLRGLSENWRQLMFEGLRADSKYRDVVATLSATGARPAEFEKGILVSIEGADSLRFVIAGAKTSNGKFGQAERSFTVAANRPELAYLRERVAANGGALTVTARAGALSDKIRQLSMKVFPLYKSEVSAYVFRHQMAADLKASGLADEDVSAALGHSVDETKGAYGAAQSARGRGAVSDVRASTPVRQKTREKLYQLGRERSRDRER